MSDTKIYIYYMHYLSDELSNTLKKRPSWFNYKLCLESLLTTTRAFRDSGQIILTIWFDGTLEEFQSDRTMIYLMSKVHSGVQVKIAKWGSMSATCNALRSYIKQNEPKIRGGDWLYILENDYLHREGWVESTYELLASDLNFDYLSLYDHSDNYKLKIHQNFIQKLFYTDNYIWKKIFTTCGSYLTNYSQFIKDITFLANPDFVAFAYLNMMGRELICSVPGFSTHCTSGLESPGVNWSKVAQGHN